MPLATGRFRYSTFPLASQGARGEYDGRLGADSARDRLIVYGSIEKPPWDLSREDDKIILTIQDNGQGLPAREVQSNGMGLTNMRERVTIAGGEFTISSGHSRGTILTAQFPLSQQPSLLEKQT